MLGYLGTSWTIFMMQRFEIAEVAKNTQKTIVFQCFCSLSRCYVGAFWSLVGAPSCFHGASEASGVRSKIHAPKMLPRCLHTHQCFKTLRHKQQSSKCYTTLKCVTRFPFLCQTRFPKWLLDAPSRSKMLLKSIMLALSWLILIYVAHLVNIFSTRCLKMPQHTPT